MGAAPAPSAAAAAPGRAFDAAPAPSAAAGPGQASGTAPVPSAAATPGRASTLGVRA